MKIELQELGIVYEEKEEKSLYLVLLYKNSREGSHIVQIITTSGDPKTVLEEANGDFEGYTFENALRLQDALRELKSTIVLQRLLHDVDTSALDD